MSLTTPSNIRKLQIKLYRKAKTNRNIASTCCTTRYTERTFCPMPMNWREPTRARRSRWAELRRDRVDRTGEVVDWDPRGATQQDVSTTTGAAGENTQARWR